MAEIQQCLQRKSQFVLQVSSLSPSSYLELELQSLWTAWLWGPKQFSKAKWNLQGAQKEFWASWWFRHSCSTNTIVVLHSTDKISFTDCYPPLLWKARKHQRTLGSASKTKILCNLTYSCQVQTVLKTDTQCLQHLHRKKQCSIIASSKCARETSAFKRIRTCRIPRCVVQSDY